MHLAGLVFSTFRLFLRVSVRGTCARASSLPAQVYTMPADANKISQRVHTCVTSSGIRAPWLHRLRRRSCTRARSSTLRSDVYQNLFKMWLHFHCVRAHVRHSYLCLPANHMAVGRRVPQCISIAAMLRHARDFAGHARDFARRFWRRPGSNN